MQKILIKLIKLYQIIPGPWHNNCRHIPTCSNYALDAINNHGTINGIYLTIKRLLKCNPWGSYGYDPVPERIRK